jgi:HlyD family secretion protein
MDIPRDTTRSKAKRRLLMAVGGALLIASTVALARLEPAAPSVDRASLWTDSVRIGTMVRQVRGPGTLVPERIRFISAVTAGRVERVLALPGMEVNPETPLVQLSNPEVQLQAMEGQRQLAGSAAGLANLSAQLENQRLNQEAVVESVRSQHREATRQAEASRQLADRGLIPRLEFERVQDTAFEMARRLEIEEKRLEFLAASMTAQIDAQLSEVDRIRSLARLQQTNSQSLAVHAGTSGVLREIPLQEGEWVAPGSRLAVVVQPGRLKAELRIPETQARDVTIGQIALIDTRNGIVEGRVTRIDPAVANGTVTVDIALEGELPRGTRPDLSVDGTIELERLENVLHTGRPAYAQPEGTIGMFVLEADGRHARRVSVRLGRTSVNTIEIVSGLEAGQIVILSDMSQWDSADRVRVR